MCMLPRSVEAVGEDESEKARGLVEWIVALCCTRKNSGIRLLTADFG